MTVSMTNTKHHGIITMNLECHNAFMRCYIVMLNAIMLKVVAPFYSTGPFGMRMNQKLNKSH
jgi:hypothetical protein